VAIRGQRLPGGSCQGLKLRPLDPQPSAMGIRPRQPLTSIFLPSTITLSAHWMSFATVEQTVSIASKSFPSLGEQPKKSLFPPLEFEVALVDKLLKEEKNTVDLFKLTKLLLLSYHQKQRMEQN